MATILAVLFRLLRRNLIFLIYSRFRMDKKLQTYWT